MERNQSLHTYIKEELLHRIKTNQYKPGEKIPPELELCKSFNVSRTTVRTALNQLTLEGYLVRQQGRGTFVADTKVKQALSQTIRRYSDQVADQGKHPEIEVLDISVIAADELLANHLDVNLQDPIQRIERVRRANGEPTQYEVAYVPWSAAPGIKKEHAGSSLYQSLNEHFDVWVSKTSENIEIAIADEQICKFLECEQGLPCFYIETLAECEDGSKVEFSRSFFRGDKTNFSIERTYSK
ncbi:GntR family transcriptional regulator [Oceanobacillus sp. CFH 90083]|uniref:GntR family transcriptional regulator n=1 Tax=Oceanobacillus sp. CFH 90083 TaxID=2592336 RepID=UPI00128C7786|nr:GntR family transcriptional regulator [Oceanobacillus sp. CFH 90083]